MAKKQKFYAVRSGHIPGIYTSWDECRKATEGFSGAIYKSFPTRVEAEAFLSGDGEAEKGKYYAVRLGERPGIYRSWEACQKAIGKGHGARYKSFLTLREAEGFMCGRETGAADALSELTAACPVAYTDGSFSPDLPVYGYGAVILYFQDGEVQQEELSGSGSNADFLESRNIAGETLAVLKTLAWATEKGYREMIIHYDYIGLEKCADGSWNPRKPVLQAYARELREKFQDRIKIHFRKVKGHSNNLYNDRADALAKAGLRAV